MDEEKDERPLRPSTSIPPAQGYCGPGNSYYLPFIYTYAWGSQLPSMPHFGPTMLYPPSSNAEEPGRVQNTILSPSMPYFGPTMLNPSSSNAEESGRVQNIILLGVISVQSGPVLGCFVDRTRPIRSR